MKLPTAIRIVFMGSPKFAIPTLQALVDNIGVIGVITQPDQPAGRGRKITPPPVKELAQSLGIDLMQPSHLKDTSAMEKLLDWAPNLIIVAAFGQILRSAVLDLPKFGCLNVHASLLPRWRGAAPIQAAILEGDQITGVTIMRMDKGVDTGPVLRQSSLPILPDDTTESLSSRLSIEGAQLLIDTLPAYLQGDLLPQPQPETGITYAPILKKEQGSLDFNQAAAILARQVRAFYPWPGTYTIWNNQILKIHRAHAVDVPSNSPGQVLTFHNQPAISTTDGILVLDEVQLSGKKPMSGNAFLQGAHGWGI